MAEATTTKPAPAKGKGAAEGEAPKKRGKKKLLLVAVVVLVLAAGAYWFLFMRGASAQAAEPEPEPAPEPGAVVTVDPISINLADGHYLKLGIALQQTAEVAEAVDGSKALDAAITLYSGRQMSELSDPASRDELKAQLKEVVAEDYEDEVMDVYFTQYVMQ